jgi:ABC-2 type transport system ATP-binding protein
MRMIEVRALTKRFRSQTAVDDLTFTVQPGRVTGFLGPNGAGKTTTMSIVLGLIAPTGGTATIGGAPYESLRAPLHEVGALLDARALQGGRRARDHLLVLARSNGIPARRVDEVLGITGLESVASRRAGKYSLGMAQRLGIAAALLGDPHVLMFDEPVNGLDPEGIRWIRGLLRSLAAEGRTVFVSSHLMSEMALTADHLVVVGRGKLIADATVEELIGRAGHNRVRVSGPEVQRLRALLPEARATAAGNNALVFTGTTAQAVGEAAAASRLVLHELVPLQPTLEEAFMELTDDSVEFGVTREDVG